MFGITIIVDHFCKDGFAVEQTEKFINKMLKEQEYFELLGVDKPITEELDNGDPIQILDCHISKYSGERFIYKVACVLTDVLKEKDALGAHLRDKKRDFYYREGGHIMFSIDNHKEFYLGMSMSITDCAEEL